MPQIKAKRKQRPWRVMEPQEWLRRFADWRKCQPGSPKRQAYEIIKRLAREKLAAGSWAERVVSSGRPKNIAEEVREPKDGRVYEPV